MKDDVILEYQNIRQKRAQAEELVKLFKEKENALRAELLASMDVAGLDQFVSAGYTVYKKTVLHAEVTDHDRLQNVMYDLMTRARQEGRPLQDGLLLTKAVAKNAVIDYIRDALQLPESAEFDINNPQVQEMCARLGIRFVATVDVGMRKSSK